MGAPIKYNGPSGFGLEVTKSLGVRNGTNETKDCPSTRGGADMSIKTLEGTMTDPSGGCALEMASLPKQVS